MQQANDLSVIKDALAFKLQTGLPNQELSPDIWEHKDPNGAKKSPDVIFGQHDQPTLKLWTLQLENGDFKILTLWGPEGPERGPKTKNK